MLLDDDTVKELIPRIGLRLKFKDKLRKYLTNEIAVRYYL